MSWRWANHDRPVVLLLDLTFSAAAPLAVPEPHVGPRQTRLASRRAVV
jgi:hypothetical protein